MKKMLFVLALLAACLLVFFGCTPAQKQPDPTPTPTVSSQTEETTHIHTWADATCSAPKTCTECGLTEGESVEHSFNHWYPDQGSQIRICQLCGYEETAAFNLEDYYDITENVLSTTWNCDYYPDDLPGLTKNTADFLSVVFLGRNGTIYYDGTPIYTFGWELDNVTPWTDEVSSKGLIIDLTTDTDGSYLVLDKQEITIELLSLSITTETSEEHVQPALNMLISNGNTSRYIGFFTESLISSPEKLAEYYDLVESNLSGEWTLIYDAEQNCPISEKTLAGLSLSFTENTSTLNYDGAPIYSFDWILEDLCPWNSSNDSSGYSALMSVPVVGEHLVLDEKEIIIKGYELNFGIEDPNSLPTLTLSVSIEGIDYLLTFWQE